MAKPGIPDNRGGDREEFEEGDFEAEEGGFAYPLKLEDVIHGRVWLGPGTTSMMLALVLPYDCCAGVEQPAEMRAIARHCGRCGAAGWTHSGLPQDELLCLECAAISKRLKALLLGGENR